VIACFVLRRETRCPRLLRSRGPDRKPDFIFFWVPTEADCASAMPSRTGGVEVVDPTALARTA
jgi:hypothetical protein